MIVLNKRGSTPGTEARALDWLTEATGPGVAVSGVHLPGKNGKGGGEADILLLTPDGPAVVEVKGLRERLAAPVLRTSANAPWTCAGITGDPVHIDRGYMTPFDQATARMFDAKAAIAGSSRVSVAVLVMAHPGTRLTIEHRGATPHGCAIIAGNDPRDLLDWVAGLRGRRGDVWTAERVTAALDTLGVTVPDLARLTADGWASTGAPTPAPAAPAATPSRATRRARSVTLGRPFPLARRAPRRPAAPAPTHPPRPRMRWQARRGVSAALASVLLVFLVGSGVFVALLVGVLLDDLGDLSTSGPEATTSTTEAPAPLDPAPTTQPRQTAGCYPFQPC